MTVYQVHQDKKGFMWFGTENGICRYDGKEMETFYHSDLLDNEILRIHEDSWGRIWFMNLAGQLGYIKNNKIELSEIDLRLNEFNIAGKYLVGIAKRKDHGILLRYVINQEDESVLQLNNEKKISTITNNLYPINDEFIFLLSSSVLCKYNPKEDEFFKFEINYDIFKPQKGDFIKSIICLKDNYCLLSTGNQSFEFNIFEDSIYTTADVFNVGFDKLLNSSTDDKTNFFLSTSSVVIHKNEVESVTLDFNDIIFNTGTKDNEGKIWLGTIRNGIIVIPNILASLNCF